MYVANGNNFTEFDYTQGFALVYAYSFVGGTDYAYDNDPSGTVIHLTYGPNGNAGWKKPG
jgi:hypothetical protein